MMMLALLAAVILAALVIVNQIAARLAEWQNLPSAPSSKSKASGCTTVTG
jgi:hypothetical protein